MKKEKLKFINNEILTLTILGGLGRGYSVYKEEVKEGDKNEFKSFLRKELCKYTEDYKNKVAEKQHIENIKRLTKNISTQYRKILRDNRLKIGRTQKLLNLYLKYLWVLDFIPEPPHCPFDDRIISKLGLNIKWTKLDSIEDYKELVERIKEKAANHGLSVAKWELKTWNKNL